MSPTPIPNPIHLIPLSEYIQKIGNYDIKQMTRENLPDLAGWASEAFTAGDPNLTWTKEKMLTHLNADFHPEFSFVICDGSTLLGGIMAYPCQYDKGKELFLHTIVIRNDMQSKGIGKLFLQWFIDYAKTQGLTGIRLDANSHLPSYQWYKQFGFKPSGWEQQILKF